MKELNLENKKSTQEIKNFTVEKYPTGNGFLYELYFNTQDDASQAVKDFWDTREGSELIRQGLQSGMLQPFKHQITSGDRTHPRKANASDLQKHPGKTFVVQINGNTEALSPKGEAALKKLGFIE